nr:putative copia-type polyprotein [Tanacetum cinerariifolium]
MCPEEAWSGFKPSVAYFKVFGSIAYVHIPDFKRVKLDDKSKKCVFLGVSKESKAYRLYDPVSIKIIVSRDVVFDEEASWDWEKSHKESVLMNLDWGESETLPDATTLPGTSNGAGIDATSEHNEPGLTNVEEGEINTSCEDHSSSSSKEIPLVNDPQRRRNHQHGCKSIKVAKNEKWRLAMDAEIEAIEKNDTWEMTDLPHGEKRLEEPVIVESSHTLLKKDSSDAHMSTLCSSKLEEIHGAPNGDALSSSQESVKVHKGHNWFGNIVQERWKKGCSTIELSRNPILHGRSKHIDVRFHFLRDLTRDNVVRLVHCPTQDQVADIMTKPLKLDLFVRAHHLGLIKGITEAAVFKCEDDNRGWIYGIPVIGEETQPTKAQRTTLEEAKLKDMKAKNYLFQAIDRSILETMLTKDTAKDIWDSLKTKYQGTTLNKLRFNKSKIEDVDVIGKILRSMTPRFNYVVCSIEESKDLDVITIDELQSTLLVHEQRMKPPVVEEQALKISFREASGGRGRGRSGMRGRCRNGGSVRLLVNGFIQVITSVFYVLGLRNNLLSSGQLMEKGLEILKRGGSCKIYHPEKGLIMEIPMAKNRMFKFFAVAQGKKENCFNSFIKDRARLWHR